MTRMPLFFDDGVDAVPGLFGFHADVLPKNRRCASRTTPREKLIYPPILDALV